MGPRREPRRDEQETFFTFGGVRYNPASAPARTAVRQASGRPAGARGASAGAAPARPVRRHADGRAAAPRPRPRCRPGSPGRGTRTAPGSRRSRRAARRPRPRAGRRHHRTAPSPGSGPTPAVPAGTAAASMPGLPDEPEAEADRDQRLDGEHGDAGGRQGQQRPWRARAGARRAPRRAAAAAGAPAGRPTGTPGARERRTSAIGASARNGPADSSWCAQPAVNWTSADIATEVGKVTASTREHRREGQSTPGGAARRFRDRRAGWAARPRTAAPSRPTAAATTTPIRRGPATG